MIWEQLNYVKVRLENNLTAVLTSTPYKKI